MTKRLQKEFESIQKTNADMKVSLPTNDLSLWHVEFQGAKGTLYEGEYFTLQLKFNNDYVLIIIILSLSNHLKSSLLSIFPPINTFIQMDLSVFQSCTMVLFETNFRMVTCLDCQFDLPIRFVNVEQRSEKNQTFQ